jgi:hypothetical protein
MSNSTDNWITEPTAILVVHGIGHQNPIETIDQFSRTLVKTLKDEFKFELKLGHHLAKKKRSDGNDLWFDNYLRISRVINDNEAGPSIDIYEYYWAHYTEDQASLTDISSWVGKVTSGAKKFYKENRDIGQQYDDQSAFFENKKFQYWKYSFFVYLIGAFLPALSFFINQTFKALAYVPIIGIPFRWAVSSFSESKLKYIANVIGDIAIYNTTDEKSRFYKIRQEILTGAVKAIRYLIEKDEKEGNRYKKVLIAGHSLGSQVSYDALNRLIHLANTDELEGFRGSAKEKLKEVLRGFITFGSPLDKIAFFLRENVNNSEYVRAQILNNFHSFKQRDWSPKNKKEWKYKIEPVFERLLEEMTWINFYDKRDSVSGSLDYYQHLENIDINFKTNPFSFTHSWYWKDERMFKLIIHRFLL